jgi:hypothetical protein
MALALGYPQVGRAASEDAAKSEGLVESQRVTPSVG